MGQEGEQPRRHVLLAALTCTPLSPPTPAPGLHQRPHDGAGGGVTCLRPQKESQEESLAASMELCSAERESRLFLTQHSLAALSTLDSIHWVRFPPPSLQLLLTLRWDHSYCSAHPLSFLGSEARVVSERGLWVSSQGVLSAEHRVVNFSKNKPSNYKHFWGQSPVSPRALCLPICPQEPRVC